MNQEFSQNPYIPPPDALNATLKKFGILAKDLAKLSGVHEQSISKFRTGRQGLNSDSLYRLEVALMQIDKTAGDYYFALRQGKPFPESSFVAGLRQASEAIANLIERANSINQSEGVTMCPIADFINKWCQRRGLSLEEFKQLVSQKTRGNLSGERLDNLIECKVFPSEDDLFFLGMVTRDANGDCYTLSELWEFATGVKSLNGDELTNH